MIYQATNNDLSTVKKIIKDEFNVDFTLNDFTKIYIYVEKDIIIGLMIYDLIYDRIELNYIWVDKNYRKNKIATKLMDLLILNSNNLDNISLEVNVNNEAAINLYKKYNFNIVSIRRNYYNGDDGYLMVRK